MTPSCRTIASACVMNEISPSMKLLPRFQTTANPMLSIKNSGIKNESMVRIRTMLVRMTAITA